MRRLLASFAFVLLFVALVACRGSSAHFPERHRAAAEKCVNDPTAGMPGPPTPDGGLQNGEVCRVDADCGKRGHCIFSRAGKTCVTDQCDADTDCPRGQACLCGGGNSCVAANCRTDADCGGLGCSPTPSTSCSNMSGTVGYYCHTRKDECTDDGDCKKGKDQGSCVYQPTASKWTCSFDTCVG